MNRRSLPGGFNPGGSPCGLTVQTDSPAASPGRRFVIIAPASCSRTHARGGTLPAERSHGRTCCSPALCRAVRGYVGTAVLPAAPPRSAVPAHPDDKTIVHVLNRIGFGPAPGDLERIRRIGLARYIDQQLDPGSIPNADLAPRLAPLLTLNLSTKQLADRYFVPAMMERRRTARLQVDGAAGPRASPR